LLAAKKLFADAGFENTSTMSIARAAQTSSVGCSSTVDPHLVLEPSIGFRDNGRKAAASVQFDFLDEVYAVSVIGAFLRVRAGISILLWFL